MACKKCQKANSGTQSVCSECGESLILNNFQGFNVVQKDGKSERSKGLKIFDYILAGFAVLEGIVRIIMAISGNGDSRSIISFILPFLIAGGLIQHKKGVRIISIILLVFSIALPLIVLGMYG